MPKLNSGSVLVPAAMILQGGRLNGALLLLALLGTWVSGAQPPAATATATPSLSSEVFVGVAKVDITPELPMRLTGYPYRQGEAERAETRLYARALVIGTDVQKPAVVIAVEAIGVSAELSDAVAATLLRSHGIERARVAVCATHIHTAPPIAGVLSELFSGTLSPEDEKRNARYMQTLESKLAEVAAAALAARQPARLAWGEGKAGFAVNRRKIVDAQWVAFGADPKGTVDHSLPLLRVTDPEGRLRAVFLNYACHGTTLVAEHNFVHADWPGDAAAKIEARHPGIVALVAQGCGADANPFPREELPHVSQHGSSIAAEVDRLLGTTLVPLGPVTTARIEHLELPLDGAATRETLAARAVSARTTAGKYTAAKWLKHLDGGNPLPTTVPYPLQTWAFGDDLVMVFLGGEVVSEYALRLERELDATRLWVNAYANSVPCYIPSRRMFAEGGFEVSRSMDLYGWPTQLSPGIEDQIIAAVRAVVPTAFRRVSGN